MVLLSKERRSWNRMFYQAVNSQGIGFSNVALEQGVAIAGAINFISPPTSILLSSTNMLAILPTKKGLSTVEDASLFKFT